MLLQYLQLAANAKCSTASGRTRALGGQGQPTGCPCSVVASNLVQLYGVQTNLTLGLMAAMTVG